MEMLTLEQFQKMGDAFEQAKADDTPYLVMKDDELHVLGDVNKTEQKLADYTIRFAFPKTDEWRDKIKRDKLVKETQNYLIVEREIKGHVIPSRYHSSVVAAFARLENFFKMISEDGTIKDVSDSEMLAIVETFNSEIVDSIYEVVGAALRIDPTEVDWMILDNVATNVIKIVGNTPEVANEADLFTE